MRAQKGFLMLEVLLAILILAIAFVSFAAVIGQVLKVTSVSQDLTRALLKYEELIFEMENGQRNDLVHYGGRERMDYSGRYEFEMEMQEGNYFSLRGKMLWRRGKNAFDSDFILPGVPIQ